MQPRDRKAEKGTHPRDTRHGDREFLTTPVGVYAACSGRAFIAR
jgi:hypothetical protein